MTRNTQNQSVMMDDGLLHFVYEFSDMTTVYAVDFMKLLCVGTWGAVFDGFADGLCLNGRPTLLARHWRWCYVLQNTWSVLSCNGIHGVRLVCHLTWRKVALRVWSTIKNSKKPNIEKICVSLVKCICRYV